MMVYDRPLLDRAHHSRFADDFTAFGDVMLIVDLCPMKLYSGKTAFVERTMTSLGEVGAVDCRFLVSSGWRKL